MLGIILFILKVLGIIVLCLLGLVLLILLLVLFAPITYSSEGGKHGEDLQVKALVTYLNPIVRVKVSYPDEAIVRVKIFGITVFPTKSKDKKSDGQKEKESQKTGESGLAGEASANVERKVENIVEEVRSMPEKEVGAADDKEGSIRSASKQSEEQKSETSKSKQEQSDAKNSTLDTIGYYASLLKENQGLIIDVLKIILKALKTILPRKCRINAVFGTGQADITGFIYGAYCSLQESLPGEIYLEPVWTEAYAEGEYYLKGKIRIIHFLVAVVKIIANKKVRLLIKKLRRV